MSQPPYPNPSAPYSAPYAPSPYGQANPLDAILSAARRASVMMFLMGAVGLLCGTCFVGMGIFFIASKDSKDPQVVQMLQSAKMPDGQPMDPTMAAVGCIVVGATILAYFLSLLVLGFFVRRGTRGPLIFAVILTGVGALATLLFGVLAATQQPAFALFYLLPVPFLILTTVWLIQAIARATVAQQWRAYLAGYPASPGYPAAYPAPAYMQSPAQPLPPPPPPPPTPPPAA